MLLTKAIAKGNAQQERVIDGHYQAVNAWRDDARHALPEIFINAGQSPRDLYREWDNQTVPQFRLDEGDNILNRLMPLSRSLPIGRTVLENARASDAGNFQQSMTGEHGSVFDNVDYDLDGTIIPVNSNGFKRNWREGEQLSLEQFDDASNQQREATRTHRQGVIGTFMDGHKDKSGQIIVEKGLSWSGVRADSRVDQVDLGAGGLNIDFTSAVTTGEDFRNAWIALAQRRAVDNKVAAPATFFVSLEIYFNMARKFSENYNSGSILDNLLTVPGVAGIEMSSVLLGNQVLSFPVSSQYVQPLVGMGVSTIACPRPAWNSPFAFEVVSAIGWNIKTDFGSTNRAVQYAAS